jgi:hypothetical protein
MLKKFVFLALIFVGLGVPSVALASQVSDEQIICPQPYGGGVVCGIRTRVHEPVETGIADNLALFGALTLGVSGTLFYFSKKINRSEL